MKANMKAKLKPHKLLSMLLALVMVVGLLPMGQVAYAASNQVIINGKYLTDTCPFYYNGASNVESERADVTSGYAHYNPETGILELNNFDGGQIYINVTEKKNITIELKGTNKITSTEHFGIWNSGTSDMIITSSDPNATLEINVENSDTVEGIKGGSSSGSVTLKGYADVTVKAKTTGNYKYFFGIVAYDIVSIIENASFTAICNGAGQAGYGIFSTGGGITLDTYGDVYIDVFQVGTYGIGIYEDSGKNNIKRVDSLTVRYKGNDGSFYPPSLFDSVKDNYVINIKETGNEGIATYRYGTAHKVTVTNGTCDVTGTSTGQFLAGDTVKVTANDAPEGYQLKGWTSDDVSVPYISVLTTSFTMPDKDVTVSAEYALRPLTVTFDTNGHGTAPSNQIVNYGEKANKPKDLTAEGYTFAGWYKDAACTIPFDFKNTPITEDITLYANWLIGTIWTVEFANGNTASTITTELPEAQLVADGNLAAKPELDPTAEGKLFAGWMKDPTGYTGYFDFATEKITKDITLYADWADPYYVYFNANGGTGTMDPVAVIPGDWCTIPECGFTAPEGKYFKGWAFDANSTEVVQFTSMQVSGSDNTLYAIWGDVHNHSWATEYSKDENYHWVDCTAAGCDITANSYKLGYDAHHYDQEIATDEYKAADGNCTAPATYYKSCICGAKGTETFESGEVNTSNHTGTLSGWQTDSDKHWKEYSCCGAKVEEGTHVYDDDTDTTCNTCDHERTVAHEHAITVTDGKATVGAGTEISKAAEGTTVTLTANAAPTDKVFDKWEVVSGSITLADVTSATTTFVMPAGAVSVKATYKDKPVTTYTVSFAANGGTGTMADVTGISGEYTLPANGFTAPAGKQFKAWSVGGVEKAAGDTITVNANTTVTAIWENIPVTYYTVTFDSNGGSAVTAQSIEAGQKATKPADPTKDGYDFKGWTLNGSAYDFNTAVNGNITLVATWEQQQVVPTTYTVSFDANGGTLM